MWTKIHSAIIVPRQKTAFKRVGLHYIAFSDTAIQAKGLVSRRPAKIAENADFVTNLG
jgi:hypothetical protein